MKQRKISIPYVAWRNGRPRFSPGKNIRAHGLFSTDLRHPESGKIKPETLLPGTKNLGAWFGPGEAMDWSAAFARKLKALEKQAAQKAPKPTSKPRARATMATAPRGSYPVSRLIEDWKKSPAFKEDISDKTRTDYTNKLKALEKSQPDLWAAEIDALDRPIIFGLYEALRAERGLAMSKGIIRALSSAITWGLNKGKFKIRDSNPCLQLRMKGTPPRVRYATRTELLALVRAADLVGRQDMGDSFILGVWSGQRQGDRLQLQLTRQKGTRIQAKQAKTGALVDMRAAPELIKRQEASQKRRLDAGIVSNHMILFEKTWRPFNQETYRHFFAEIRTAAANGLWRADDGRLLCPVNEPFRYLKDQVAAGPPKGTCVLEPCRSLADFWEMDLRDTAVTWMALAGAEIPEICSVTGHSIQSATHVLKHYLATHPEMADSAIAKMVTWYEAGGETESGF